MEWFKELSWFKKALVIIGIIVLGNVVWSGITSLLVSEHVEGITEEFIPLHNALEKAAQPEKQFSLEETIRVIHAIEHAKENESDDFQEFLVFMAGLDYSRVAPDVIECQQQLLPILQDLYFAQSRLEDHESAWQIVKDMGGVTHHLLSSGVDFLSLSVVDGTKEMLIAAKDGLGILIARDDKSDELKSTVRSVKDAYIDYLATYSKVYYKHMHEWNKLCLERDAAYMHIHEGRIRSAEQYVDKALAVNAKDKESRLLKALCLLQTSEPSLHLASGDTLKPITPPKLIEAKEILDKYVDEFPDRSAPALVLLGVYHHKIGEMDLALGNFDQADKEFPLQASHLKDMFNSYKQRAYLSKSRKSRYILELYKSSMEGFGIFSPNFHQAMIYQADGNLEKAREEIKMHFYRRNNQFRTDYIISDLNFCNNYLNSSFNSMFLEKGFIDIETKTGELMMADNEVKVTLTNRTDLTLENVRLLLCVHYTDTYSDDYEYTRLPDAFNRIPKGESVSTTVSLVAEDREINAEKDVVSFRGILITDNFVAWVDKDEVKEERAKKNMHHIESSQVDAREGVKEILERVSLTDEVIDQLLRQSLIAVDNGLLKDEIEIKLPRQLSFLEPVFRMDGSIGSDEAIRPDDSHLSGPNIKLKFDVKEPKSGQFDLFLHSAYLSCKITITKEEGSYSVNDVEFI